jgi:hypothetical protein
MLLSRWPLIGAAIALALFVPNLAWQATHDWMSVQYTLSHRGHTDAPLAYWLQQLLAFNPLFLVPGTPDRRSQSGWRSSPPRVSRSKSGLRQGPSDPSYLYLETFSAGWVK